VKLNNNGTMYKGNYKGDVPNGKGMYIFSE
jgi:hypothetical protein